MPEILVVTFTEAATAELRDRIRGRLAEVLESFEGDEALDPFCQTLLDQHRERSPEIIRRLQRAIASLDEAAIHTIHAFCQRVLVQSAFESGADFGMEILSDIGPVLDEIAADFWREQVYPADSAYTEYLLKSKASPEEWLRVVYGHLGQPLLHTVALPPLPDSQALAAALPHALTRYQQLWLENAASIRPMLLEMSAKKELKQTSYKPEQLEKVFLLIDDHIASNGGWQDIDSKELAKLSSSKLASGTAKTGIPPSHAFFDAAEELASLISDLSGICQLKEKHALAELRRRCDSELPERLARRQQLSFNDLLLRVWQGLQDGDRLATAIRRRYKAALIDEFQDTDGIQYDIFSHVFSDGSTPLFLVGDPKQAIYSFRGADIHAYHQAEKLVEAKESLDTNQRSVPHLVTAVNTLFLRPKEAFVDPHVSFTAVYAASKARPELHIAGEDGVSAPFRFQLFPEPEQVSEKGVQISWSKETANSLAAQITAAEIEKLLSGVAKMSGAGVDKAISGGDIAVLVPDRFRAKTMQDALSARGIASVLRVRDSVWESQEARDLYSVLAAIAEPANQGLLRAALISTLLGSNAAALLRLEISGWDNISDAFAHWKKTWQAQGFIPMFREWLEYQGLDGRNVAQRLLSLVDGERRLTNLLQLAELLQAHKATGLEQHLAWFSRQSRNAGDEALLRLESDEDRVRIVTLHASKGLEYPIVFCPFLWDGRLLGRQSKSVRFHADKQAVVRFRQRRFGSAQSAWPA